MGDAAQCKYAGVGASFLFPPRLFLEEQVNMDNPLNTVRNLCLILKHSREDVNSSHGAMSRILTAA